MASVVISSSKSNLANNSSTLQQPPPPSDFDVLKCMYLNATSLENKLDEFKVVVSTYRPKIIAVSETWFKSISNVNMNGYNVYRRDRNDGRRGGGVCLYIDQSIESFELSDARFNLSKIEHIWATIYFGKDKYLVGCIYRPNDFIDMNDFDLVFKQAKYYVDEKGY